MTSVTNQSGESATRARAGTSGAPRARAPGPPSFMATVMSHSRYVLFAAATSAVLLSAVHVLVTYVEFGLIGRIVWQSRDFVWMAPLGYLLLFLTAVPPVAAITMLASRGLRRRLVAVCFLTASFVGALLLLPWLHPLAALLLAFGAAFRVSARAAEPRQERRIAVLTGVLITALALLSGIHAFNDRKTLASERRASIPSGAPNVLLLIWDTVRAANLSLYGYARPTTPALDGWARDALVFDWAFSTAPWTLPSHASIMTGVWASEQTGDWNTPLDRRHPTLAEYFSSRGYATGGFVANLYYTHAYSGLRRGFATYEEHRRSLRQVLLSTSFLQVPLIRAVLTGRGEFALRRASPYWVSHGKDDGSITDGFLRWQSGLGGRPFFAFLNYINAHGRSAPHPYDTLFGRDASGRSRYDRAIAFLDSEVARLLDSLRTRGELERTVIVLTSDHGELLGEHGLDGHGLSLYTPELHVPLVIRFPAAVPGGGRVSGQVSLRNLARTIVALTNPVDSVRFPGHALVPLGDGRTVDDSLVLAEVSQGINTDPAWPVTKGDMAALFDGTHQYIENGDGSEELYAYREYREPGGVVNLRSTPQGVAHTERMRRFLTRARAGRMVGAPIVP